MRRRYDDVTVVTSIAAVSIVFGFLGGVVADTETVAVPIAAITFLLTGAVFLLSRPALPPRIITSAAKPGS